MPVESFEIKMLKPNVFGLMKQSSKKTKVTFRELYALENFGHFAEIENSPAFVNAFVDEEHDVQMGQSQKNFDVLEEVVDLTIKKKLVRNYMEMLIFLKIRLL